MSVTDPLDVHVVVRPFEHSVDGGEATIGDHERRVFLAIPREGLDLLLWLRSGMTLPEAVAEFERRHGEAPDVEEFLDVLEAEGFVSRSGPGSELDPQQAAAAVTARPVRRFAFDRIPPHIAAALCGPAALTVLGLLIAVGIALAAADPGLIPPPSVLLYEPKWFALQTIATAALVLVAVGVHELAHAVVARASGLSVRFGIGHLIYQPVAQTDISGIWMVPRRRRYLAFLYGTIVDAASASLVLVVLWAQARGTLSLPEPVFTVVQALLLTYAFRMSFQLLFYMRTDLYYVLLVATRSANLMGDTEQFLRNLVLRAVRLGRLATPQDGLPRRQRRLVRGYAVLWFGGRVFEISVLVTLYIPLLVSYAVHVTSMLWEGETGLALLNLAVAAGFVYLIDGVGIAMWLRTLGRIWRRRIGVVLQSRQARRSPA